MKKTTIIIAAIIMMAGFTTKSMAQATLLHNTAGATLLTTIGLSQTSGLNFGTIAIGAGPGTVSINTAGNRTIESGSGITLLTSGVSAPHAGVFSVTGTAGYTYSVAMPGTITVSSGANTMTIDSYVAKADAGTEAAYNSATAYTIPVGGVSTYYIGGLLHISSSQAQATYAGEYAVTVNYN